MQVEEDGDEVLVKTDYCARCRIGFDKNDKPIYAKLEPKNGFRCCVVCGGSYGAV